jgi:hypothetical protein
MLTLPASCGSSWLGTTDARAVAQRPFTGYASFGAGSSPYLLSSTVIDQLRDESLNP